MLRRPDMGRREVFNRSFDAARRRRAELRCRGVASGLSAIAVAVGLGWAVAAPAMELVSVDLFNQTGNAASGGVSVNADGNFVAFYSDASDLVLSDTNQVRDVFLRDRIHQTTELVSVNNAGQQGNRASEPANDYPSIDGDGQIVAFDSDATNLVPNDLNGHTDVFVRLRASSTTELVSVSSSGAQGDGNSTNASIDRAGRFVAFQSLASNLVSGDTNNLSD